MAKTTQGLLIFLNLIVFNLNVKYLCSPQIFDGLPRWHPITDELAPPMTASTAEEEKEEKEEGVHLCIVEPFIACSCC